MSALPKPPEFTPEELREHSRWKFDTIDALLGDERLTNGEVRAIIRVLQQTRPVLRIAVIGDAAIKDDVAHCPRLRDVRKRGEALGIWEVEEGHGGRTTAYRFLDSYVNARLDIRTQLRDLRREERLQEKRAHITRQKERRDEIRGEGGSAPAPKKEQEGCYMPSPPVEEGGPAPCCDVGGQGARTRREGVPAGVVHLHTPSHSSLPYELETPRAHASAHAPARARPFASDELVVGRSDQAAMRMLFGGGSYALGRDRLKLLPKGEWWDLAGKLEQRGLTARDVAEVEERLAGIEARCRGEDVETALLQSPEAGKPLSLD